MIKLKTRHKLLQEVVSQDLIIDNSRTRRLAVEIGYFEKYRYAQLQNRELKSELIRVRLLVIFFLLKVGIFFYSLIIFYILLNKNLIQCLQMLLKLLYQ